MKGSILVVFFFLLNPSFAQVVVNHSKGIIPGERGYTFPYSLDTLDPGIQIVYMVRDKVKNDSVYYTLNRSSISDDTLIGTAVYVNKNLSLTYRDMQVALIADRNFLGLQSFNADGLTESVHLYWGDYYYDSTGCLELVDYMSSKRIAGARVECSDSAFIYYPNGNIRQKETYLNCEDHGTWIYYDQDQNIIKRQYYSKGKLLREEEYTDVKN